MLQQWSMAQNLRISTVNPSAVGHFWTINYWSFFTTTASSGAVLTAQMKAFRRPFSRFHKSTNSSLVLSAFCIRHKSYIWLYQFGRSTLVQASLKPQELLTNLSNIAFSFIPLWNSVLTLFLTENFVCCDFFLFLLPSGRYGNINMMLPIVKIVLHMKMW